METATPSPAVTEVPRGWPDVVPLDVWIVHERGTWYAICTDFNIAAAGKTRAAAVKELEELISDYVSIEVAEGRTYREALRRTPLPTRLKLHAYGWLSSALRLFAHREERARETGMILRPHLNGQPC